MTAPNRCPFCDGPVGPHPDATDALVCLNFRRCAEAGSMVIYAPQQVALAAHDSQEPRYRSLGAAMREGLHWLVNLIRPEEVASNREEAA